jgi:transcriptional regulator with XRE-family HTH domain
METTYTPAQLRSLRESIGLTLEQLSKATGINYTMLSMIETGARRPSAATAIRLSQYYGEPLDRFWTFSKVAN